MLYPPHQSHPHRTPNRKSSAGYGTNPYQWGDYADGPQETSFAFQKRVEDHQLECTSVRLEELQKCIHIEVWECLDPGYQLICSIPSKMFLTPKKLTLKATYGATSWGSIGLYEDEKSFGLYEDEKSVSGVVIVTRDAQLYVSSQENKRQLPGHRQKRSLPASQMCSCMTFGRASSLWHNLWPFSRSTN